MEQDIRPLLVIGAGPKAAAIAAKSKVLRKLGLKAPRVLILERTEVCANWSGDHGFTDGKQLLGTPPEKDVGFPYMEDSKDPEVTKALFSEFSWPSYLNFSRYRYGDWIDRGRPSPTHEDWARYIREVISGATNDRENQLMIGKCSSIELAGNEWQVTIATEGKPYSGRFSGIVVTGPGTPKIPFDAPVSRLIQDGDTFWSTKKELLSNLDTGQGALPIVVVGGGETAAAIVSHIVDLRGDRLPPGIIVLTRHGAIFSRGEGYYENSRFTDSRDWQSLNHRARREVIDRTDRGVFSTDSIRKLSIAQSVRHQCFEVTDVKIRGNRCLELIGAEGPEVIECQLLICALGFDPFWFIELMPEPVKSTLKRLGEMTIDSAPEILSLVQRLPKALYEKLMPKVIPAAPRDREGRRNMIIESLIQHDLSLPSELVPAKLYLPMVSAFSQGPGFPNLSCLGDLSDRILQREPIVRP